MKRFNLKIIVQVILFCSIAARYASGGAGADLTVKGWVTNRGANTVDVSDGVVHIDQSGSGPTADYATATQHLSLDDCSNWSVSFEFKLGVRRPAGSSVELKSGQTRVLYAGGDCWGSQGPNIILGDQSLVRLANDNSWHDVELSYSDGTGTVSFDGKAVGSGKIDTPPDSIIVGTVNPNASQQTEIWVKSVMVKRADAVVSASTGASQTIFSEHFNDDTGLARRWKETLNGGTLSMGDLLAIKGNGNGMPVIETRSDPFPVTGDWSISVGYRYTSIGNYGDGVYCKDRAGTNVFDVHQDLHDQLIQMNGQNLIETPANLDWHVLSVVKKGPTLLAYLDGVAIGQDSPQESPVTITAGGSPQTNPWDWNDLALQFIQVDRGEHVEDKSALRVAPAAPIVSPSIEDASTISPQQAPPQPSGTKWQATGVDPLAVPPASVGTDGHLIVTATKSQISLSDGDYIEFRPVVDPSRFTGRVAALNLYVNNRFVQEKDLFVGHPAPSFTVTSDRSNAGPLRIRIVAQDEYKQEVPILESTVTPSSVPSKPNIGFALQGERIVLDDKLSGTPHTDYVFLEGSGLGGVSAPDKFAIDGRVMPPGQYRIWCVADLSDGTLLHPVSSSIDISPRFTLTSPAMAGVFEVTDNTPTVQLHATEQPDASIAKALVYVNGEYVAQNASPDFDVQLPLSEVPSGSATVQVVGVSKDGVQFAPEAVTVQVKNDDLDELAARDAKYQALAAAKAKLADFDEEIEHWYALYLAEPDFVTYSSGIMNTSIIATPDIALLASTSYLNSITVPGNKSEYLAQCRETIIGRAKLRLEIGRMCKDLGLRNEAGRDFQQVIFEVGADSGVGSQAAEELRAFG